MRSDLWSADIEFKLLHQFTPTWYLDLEQQEEITDGKKWFGWEGILKIISLQPPPDQVLFKGETEARRFTQENCAKGSSTKVCLSHPAVWQPCSWETVNIQLMRNNRLILATFKCQKLRLQLLSSPCSLHPSASLPEGALCLMPLVFFTAFSCTFRSVY